MTLPAAAPAINGSLIPVSLKRCWADSFIKGRPCGKPSTERLGLCVEHTEELLDT